MCAQAGLPLVRRPSLRVLARAGGHVAARERPGLRLRGPASGPRGAESARAVAREAHRHDRGLSGERAQGGRLEAWGALCRGHHGGRGADEGMKGNESSR